MTLDLFTFGGDSVTVSRKLPMFSGGSSSNGVAGVAAHTWVNLSETGGAGVAYARIGDDLWGVE